MQSRQGWCTQHANTAHPLFPTAFDSIPRQVIQIACHNSDRMSHLNEMLRQFQVARAAWVGVIDELLVEKQDVQEFTLG